MSFLKIRQFLSPKNDSNEQEITPKNSRKNNGKGSSSLNNEITPIFSSNDNANIKSDMFGKNLRLIECNDEADSEQEGKLGNEDRTTQGVITLDESTDSDKNNNRNIITQQPSPTRNIKNRGIKSEVIEEDSNINSKKNSHETPDLTTSTFSTTPEDKVSEKPDQHIGSKLRSKSKEDPTLNSNLNSDFDSDSDSEDSITAEMELIGRFFFPLQALPPLRIPKTITNFGSNISTNIQQHTGINGNSTQIEDQEENNTSSRRPLFVLPKFELPELPELSDILDFTSLQDSLQSNKENVKEFIENLKEAMDDFNAEILARDIYNDDDFKDEDYFDNNNDIDNNQDNGKNSHPRAHVNSIVGTSRIDANDSNPNDDVIPGGIIAAIQPETSPPINQVILPQSAVREEILRRRRRRHKKRLHKLQNQQHQEQEEIEVQVASSSTNAHNFENNAFSNSPSMASIISAVEKEDVPEASIDQQIELRKQILSIWRQKGVSNRVKDKLIQTLMTEVYYKSKAQVGVEKDEEEDDYDDSDYDSNDDLGYTSNESDDGIDPVSTSSQSLTIQHGHNHIKTIKQTWFNKSEGILGCQHYQRNCQIQCSTCNKFYTCRFCHDSKESSHKLIRCDISTVRCMLCNKLQPATSNECIQCHEILSYYFCDICKLYDNDSTKEIYHCDDCGICRIGDPDQFFHCIKCNACISNQLKDSHKCIEKSTESDCPICGEYMFTSIYKVVVMPCGHSIHEKCYNEYVKQSYKCPICLMTIINMQAQFRILDIEISRQKMPNPYCNWRCVIYCNDCYAKDNVPFHFLGLKCCNCRSYNTVQLKLIKPISDSDEEYDDDDDDDEGLHEERLRNLMNSSGRQRHSIEEARAPEIDITMEVEGPQAIYGNFLQ